ncbi:MAG: hypothetical protein ACR2NP_13960 [Pirellulaceae bacterium]
MTSLRLILPVLSAIILIKSFHCAVAEAADFSAAVPCNCCDSGCLCKGVVFVEPIRGNEAGSCLCHGLVDLQQDIICAALLPRVGGFSTWLSDHGALRPSGRSLRALISSLTL